MARHTAKPKSPKGRGCEGKKRHNTREAAEGAIWSLVRRRGAIAGQYNAYECGHCGAWHHGHKPNSRGKR